MSEGVARRNPGGRGIRSSRYPIPNPFPEGRGLSRFAPTLINAPPQAGGMSEGFSPTKSRRKRDCGHAFLEGCRRRRNPGGRGKQAHVTLSKKGLMPPSALPVSQHSSGGPRLQKNGLALRSNCKRGWHLGCNVGFRCRDCRKSAFCAICVQTRLAFGP